MSDSQRRRFLRNMGKWAAAGAALLSSPAVAAAARLEDDFGMHGPIRKAERWLKRPLEPSAVPLLAPWDEGEIFSRRWAFGHAVRAPDDALVLVVVDCDTGGHAELALYRRAFADRPLAESHFYAIHLISDATDWRATPLHLLRLTAKVAEILSANEPDVALDWRLPARAAWQPPARAGFPSSGATSRPGRRPRSRCLLR